MSAVSKKVMPPASAASSTSPVRSRSSRPPKLLQPRPTVDTSSSYLAWARDNLELNELAGARHELVRDDAREFLAHAGRAFDLCVLDPPSFSTRAGAPDLDVQRDHRALIEAALAVLAPGGAVYFSTNHQRFEARFEGLRATDVTAETSPPDYRRTPHRCYRIVNA